MGWSTQCSHQRNRLRPDGIHIEDVVEFSHLLKEHGADIIDVSAGQTSKKAKPVYGRAFQTPFSERIRNDVHIPTIAVGNIYDHDRINTILLAGRADLVALARAHLADPYFTLHAASQAGYPIDWPVQYRASEAFSNACFPPNKMPPNGPPYRPPKNSVVWKSNLRINPEKAKKGYRRALLLALYCFSAGSFGAWHLLLRSYSIAMHRTF